VAVAREHGYALAVHGSLQRDMDLVAVPWTDRAADPEILLLAIEQHYAVQRAPQPPAAKPHGRVAYSLIVGFGNCVIDLSFMPRVGS
jgi:hypothetical protein